MAKVLTYNPKENKTDFLTFTEKTIHTKHGRMFKVRTRRGYTIEVTDDHSLATIGTDNFFQALPPDHALGKVVPIIYIIDYQIGVAQEKESNETIDKIFNENKLTSVIPEFLSCSLEKLEFYLGSLLVPHSTYYSYCANSKEEFYTALISLARLGQSIKRIDTDKLKIHINKDPVWYVPNTKGKLVKADVEQEKNPSNPYLQLPYTWDVVVDIEEIERQETTYDFTVPEFPLFISNGILVYDTINVTIVKLQQSSLIVI